MAISDEDVRCANERGRARREDGYVVSASYDADRDRIVMVFDTGVEASFPTERAEGLRGACAEDLAEIEISPSGLGLHWPRLDADLLVWPLLRGVYGSRRWMAASLGAEGGRSRSSAKVAAARANGRKGGRPRRPTDDERGLETVSA